MSVTMGIDGEQRQRALQGRAVWLTLIVVGGAGFSLFFACATPFAALATLAALKMERLEGPAVIGLIWLANQAIGYGILGYPWTWDSLAWGVTIGLSTILAYLVATALSTTRPVRLAISLPFVAAFATYEYSLYVAAFVLPGDAAAFAFAVVRQIFLVNLLALVSLLAVSQIALAAGLDARRALPREPVPSVR